jgi:peptidoglycan/xylan/chitin deacetylase (PgdA/CDA1 family)
MSPCKILIAALTLAIASAVCADNKNENFPLKSIKTHTRVVALTFDDGPIQEITPKLLALLRQYEAKATFFNVGRKMKANTELVEAVLADGHEIGNHSWSHKRFTGLSSAEQREEIEGFQLQARKSGITPRVFRAPFLKVNADTLALLKEFDLRLISARVMANDAGKQATSDSVITKVQQALAPGSIVLMHEREHTYQALQELMPKWKQEGYQFVTVSELISIADK